MSAAIEINTEAPAAKPRERGILFSAPMVRALLDGRKTQTRRIVKKAIGDRDAAGDGLDVAGAVCPARVSGWIAWFPGNLGDDYADLTRRTYEHGFACPYGVPGDRLWVRETWCPGRGLAVTPSGELIASAGAAPPGGVLHETRDADHWRADLRSRKGGDPAEWPEDLRVREWPAAGGAR